ncbi:MAG: metallophosphoesterase family protein [Anaerolineae bacterium]|nr:metallophosphoesterase family protein [Anaerolineae bacterium]
MRIAVFSDIHGNPYACEAVLDALAADGEFDAIVFAGDLCFGGSDPARCVDLIRAADIQAVYGNTDEFITDLQPPPDEAHNTKWEKLEPDARWTAAQLGAARLDWLRTLPLDRRFSPTGDPSDDLLVVHANPKDAHGVIAPPPQAQQKLFGAVKQPDDAPELLALLEGVQAAVIAFGHFHYTSQREWRGLQLVNVAPCSIAPYDHDRRARYTVFIWDGSAWQIERRYVEYDYSQEAAALHASNMPNRAEWAKHFE